MSRLEALPLLSNFSESRRPDDRAVFVRVFGDYARYLLSHTLPIPDDWRIALEACLAKADPKERRQHLFALDGVHLNSGVKEEARGLRPSQPQPIASQRNVAERELAGMQPTATGREDVETLLQSGDLDALVALAFDCRLHLSARQVAALANRARKAVDIESDRRLAEAVLTMRPTRIEMAPLFLEANADQRWAIALAAQRAELGRRQNAAIATVARETVSRLEYAAIAGNASEFVDLLGRAIGAPPDLTRRIAEDPAGEPLAVALIAMGAPNDVCVRILTARDMHERGEFRRLLPLTRLSKSMNPLAARRIVSAMIGAPAATTSDAATPIAVSTQRAVTQMVARNDLVSRRRSLDQPRNVNTVGAK